MHNDLTARMLKLVLPEVKGKRVLDVGCGQGVAIEALKKHGFDDVLGTGINRTDLDVCQGKGFNVIEHDMHEPLDGKTFDLIWARHVLEHSPIPLYVLRLFGEMLAPDGVLYVDVPMPETACHHEANPNHYTVLTECGWGCLLLKAGFDVENAHSMKFETGAGPDQYMGYVCRLEKD